MSGGVTVITQQSTNDEKRRSLLVELGFDGSD